MIGGSTSVRVLIAGGGTAGHVLPGIAIARALVEAGLTHRDIAFAGGDRGVERALVTEAGFALTELPGRGIQRRLTWSNVSAVFQLLRGLVAGVALVRRARPAVVVVLGGYASFAVGLGAVLWRRPLVLCEQNARAGAVNRLLRFWARRSAVTFPGTDLPRSEVTGNPIRPVLVEAARDHAGDPEASRAAARRSLGLPTDRIVVLVTTGSLGARSVNLAVRGVARRWAERGDVAIRQVVGRRDHDEFVADARSGDDGGLVHQIVAYEDRMDLALAAADVVVGRSGGGVVELAAFGVPAVLVPLPIAPRDHQRANAQHLVAADAAVLLDDAACTPQGLAVVLEPLVDDADRRSRMGAAMGRMARLEAAREVADIVLEVAGEH